MKNETIDLIPEGDGKFAYTQMTLDEDHFCQLVAEGKTTRRGAYRLAFNKPLATDNAIDQWLHRVKEKRPDIAARINEYKTAIMEERREFWMNRQWEALERLWSLFITSIGNPELAMIALKAYHEMAGTLGPLHHLHNRTEIERAGIRLRIDFFHGRSEHKITASRL